MKKLSCTVLLLIFLSLSTFSQEKLNSFDFYKPSLNVAYLLYSLDKKLERNENETDVKYKERITAFLKDVYMGDSRELTLYSIWIPTKPQLRYDEQNKELVLDQISDITIDNFFNLKIYNAIQLYADIPTKPEQFKTLSIPLTLKIPFSAQKAEQVRDNIRIAFQGAAFGYIKQPYYVKSEDSNDFDTTERTVIRFIPRKYVVFDIKTGEKYGSGEVK